MTVHAKRITPHTGLNIQLALWESSLTCHNSIYCKTYSCCCWLPPWQGLDWMVRRQKIKKINNKRKEKKSKRKRCPPLRCHGKDELMESPFSEWAGWLRAARRYPMDYTTTERGASASAVSSSARASTNFSRLRRRLVIQTDCALHTLHPN